LDIVALRYAAVKSKVFTWCFAWAAKAATISTDAVCAVGEEVESLSQSSLWRWPPPVNLDLTPWMRLQI
jgi:hypothetical protein